MIKIGDDIEIHPEELTFVTSRSGGPGGQNVNKVNTKVTLLFDVGKSPSLSDEEKEKVKERLSTRVSKTGVLRVVSQRHRTQPQNRKAAIDRFVELLEEALLEDPARKKTRVPAATKRRRLRDKRHRSRIRETRSKPVDLDE